MHGSFRFDELIELTSGETVVGEFVDALDALTYPHQRWGWYQGLLTRAIEGGRHEVAKEMWREQVWPNLFGR